MKIKILILSLLLTSGCVSSNYKRNGENVSYSFNSMFVNSKAIKLAIDKKTKTTSQGLAIGEVSTEIDQESLKAFFELGFKLLTTVHP